VLNVFQGTLNSWWTRIAIGFLVFAYCLLQRVFKSGRGGKARKPAAEGRKGAAAAG
jgi:simple sugar transport system permease protein